MKKVIMFLFLFVFTLNVSAQDNLPKLPEIKSLASIEKNKSVSLINKNLEKLNSKSVLSPLAFNKVKVDKKAPKTKDFTFSINPYIWFVGVGGTIGYGPDGGKYGFNKSFSEAVEYLKMAAAAAGRFKYKQFSFLYDIAYVNLKGFETEAPQGKGIVSANWTLKETLYDLFLSYLFPSKNKNTNVEIYAGTRIWAIEKEATFLLNDTLRRPTGDIPPGIYKQTESSNVWVDPVLGVTSDFRLGKKWFAYLRGDIGGFSVNSQMTWQMTGGFVYMISPNWPTTFGFKYVGVNYEKDPNNLTVNEYGPTLSIGYRY